MANLYETAEPFFYDDIRRGKHDHLIQASNFDINMDLYSALISKDTQFFISRKPLAVLQHTFAIRKELLKDPWVTEAIAMLYVSRTARCTA